MEDKNWVLLTAKKKYYCAFCNKELDVGDDFYTDLTELYCSENCWISDKIKKGKL